MADTTAYPHVVKSEAARKKFEPAVGSNFNAYFAAFNTLKDKLGDISFLTSYVKAVSGLFVEKSGGTIEAGYKTTKFRYDSNEKETFYDVEIQFWNFLDNDSKQFVYNCLVKFAREKYNPLTGVKTLKTHYADAAITVEKFNRDQTVYWRRIGHQLFPMENIEDQIADYDSHDIKELAGTFNVGYVSDVTNDPRLGTETF